jgi:hypothetical protein
MVRTSRCADGGHGGAGDGSVGIAHGVAEREKKLGEGIKDLKL